MFQFDLLWVYFLIITFTCDVFLFIYPLNFYLTFFSTVSQHTVSFFSTRAIHSVYSFSAGSPQFPTNRVFKKDQNEFDRGQYEDREIGCPLYVIIVVT